MNLDPTARLALLDAAPPAEPDAVTFARREEMLQRILADRRPARAITRRARPAGRPRLRGFALTGGAVLAVAVTAVAVVADGALYRAASSARPRRRAAPSRSLTPTSGGRSLRSSSAGPATPSSA